MRPANLLLAVGLGLIHVPAAFALEPAAEASRLEAKVREWRRDIHQHPELGNRETRTAALVAAHLRALGLREVREGVAKTGVTAMLDTGRPGPLLALRADMDALPVTEENDLPFRSKVTTEYRGETVGVMHACGHDAHVAILMGVADALVRHKDALRGRVLFIFQPAEEGTPEGEEGGADLMLAEGVFKEKPDAVLGLHVTSSLNTGEIGYRSGPFMAASDTWSVEITGRQAHGSTPWAGVDPLLAASELVVSLQAIVAREVDITKLPAVVTVGQFKSGIRQNIIPDKANLLGTIRTFDPTVRERVIASVKRRAELIAQAHGATATFKAHAGNYPVTVNDPALTAKLVPALRAAFGEARVREIPLRTGAEDFSFFAQQVPGFYFFVGVTEPGIDPALAPTNHSPRFMLDEAGLPVAVRAMLAAAVAVLGEDAG